MPDLVLEAHRRRIPIDHPLRSVTRKHLEYPVEDASIAYFSVLNKTYTRRLPYTAHIVEIINDVFTDKYMIGWGRNGLRWQARIDLEGDGYTFEIRVEAETEDQVIVRWDDRSPTIIASKAVDLDDRGYMIYACAVGSDLAFGVYDLLGTEVNTTDTTYTSGYFGFGQANRIASRIPIAPHSCYLSTDGTLEEDPPSLAKVILEVEVTEDCSLEKLFRPNLKRELVEISRVDKIPEYLRREAKRYYVLRQRGFSDDEVEALLGYVPQHRVDTAAVSWGAFDYRRGDSRMLIVVFSDNPYRDGAIEKQKEYVRSRGFRVLRAPADYREAVEQYKTLKKEFPNLIAGKDNYASITLGEEAFRLFQVADTYYGNIVEGIRPDAYKNVSEQVMRRALNRWIERLKRVTVLTEERDKHIEKLKRVLKIGW